MPPRKPPPGAEREQERETEPVLPELEDRVRTPKFRKMEKAVEGFYIMLGGALSVLPPQMAGSQVRRVGRSFSSHSEYLADAWIDLAEDDLRVRKIIESATGVGTYGKLIGRHLEVIGDETPGIQGARQAGQPMPQSQGMTDVETAMALANLFVQSQAEQRAQQPDNGQQVPPSAEQVRRMQQEQQRQQRRPMRQQQQQPVPQEPQHPMGQGASQPVPTGQAPPMGVSRKPVGMPTPADLGVEIAPPPEDFPAQGGEADVKG